ncbi:MAG: hypothetical protein PHO10_09065 [Gemmiger sp.]|nr:hypothetical protein [Gemmiger sp.]
MKAWFQRFMSGRYGNDQFSSFLCVTSLVLLLLGMFVSGILYYLGLGLLVYCYFRMLSRNLQKRRAENQWYLQRRAVVTGWFSKYKTRFSQRATYRYFRCPRCHQEIRVPRGRGKISISCPKCGTQFIKRS